jgi:pyridoxal phosphate enzyme (YggS family)
MIESISANLELMHQHITQFEKQYSRVPGSVQLLAVSKTHGVDSIRTALAAGQHNFAENYMQEALAKIATLSDEHILWHFIGPIQSNKTKALAANFDWIHTVDRSHIAQRLHEQLPPGKAPLNVLLQVNISDEDSKAGVSVRELPELAAAVASFSRLKLCGLMAIPAPSADIAAQRRSFALLAQARATLVELGHLDCVHLSMGMSADYEAAIAEGATMIRIGTDIFGARSKRPATDA